MKMPVERASFGERRDFDLRRGFTLIELLIVVAIIAILAAIAVPNFIEAQTRAKVSRVSTDMRALSTALECYRLDNNNYPQDPGSGWIDPSGYYGMPKLMGLRPLSTPVGYMSAVPKDPFIPVQDTFPQSYVYFCPGKYLDYGPYAGRMIWQLSSVGPNKIADFNFLRYDPTNGTMSPGDIFLWGPGIGLDK